MKRLGIIKNKKETNKGITLIALVITIIVLLILAGVSIATLTGQNGILNQATGAKDANNQATALEKVQIEVMGSYGQNGNIDITKLNENLAHIKGIQGLPISSLPETVTVDGYEIEIKANGEVTITGEADGGEEIENVIPGKKVKKTIKGNYTDSQGNKVTVPAGFTISGIESEQKVALGLVIYDIPDGVTVNWTEDSNSDGVPDVQTKYNQFVWIPVASSEEYVRNLSYPSYYDNNIENTPEGSTFTDIGYLPEEIQPTNDIAEENEKAEREAIVKYNGFYVARYEAGKEDTILVSKQSATVWNNITQTNSKAIAKTMYKNTNVKSALCSGIQWDMVMKFVDQKNDAEGKLFDVKVVDSTRHTDNLANTGKNNNDKVQNIYDLEGNNQEWIAEKNNTSTSFIERGGFYSSYVNKRTNLRININKTNNGSASLRFGDDDVSNNDIAFRTILYIL